MASALQQNRRRPQACDGVCAGFRAHAGDDIRASPGRATPTDPNAHTDAYADTYPDTYANPKSDAFAVL